jgi:Fic-DOC domain mobile mystery protein B
MIDRITAQPDGATPLDDISGLLRDDITTRGQLDEAESVNILNADEWIERGRLPDVFTVEFYRGLHTRMYDQVWDWAGTLRSETGATPNIGVAPEAVPRELGRVAMEYNREWEAEGDKALVSFIARYHHALVQVHPFNNGNGRWSRLACDVVVEKLARQPRLTWATETFTKQSAERTVYIDALVAADAGNLLPIIDYVSQQNPGR